MRKYLCEKEVQHCGTCPACARNDKVSKSAEFTCSVADLAKAKVILDAILQACHEDMNGSVSNSYLNSRLGNVRILLGY